MQASSNPTALVIQIHGGGFKTGDKSNNYGYLGYQNEVNTFLNNNVAVATINYRLLLNNNEQEGVLKPLNDCKRALQFIRYYNRELNINKIKIALKGTSAGAGTSLWIGLRDDMADAASSDPVLRESTRVKAIAAHNTQATYNLTSWPSEVFRNYQPALNLNTMTAIATPETVMQFYGISNLNMLNSPSVSAYNTQVDMLSFISGDDPTIYLESEGIPDSYPQTKDRLIHHPLHAKAVMEKALSKGVNCKAYIPELNINTTNGQSAVEFIVEKLNR